MLSEAPAYFMGVHGEDYLPACTVTCPRDGASLPTTCAPRCSALRIDPKRLRYCANRVPVDQVEPRDLHRRIDANRSGDQIKRQVQPRGAAAGHDEALRFIRDNERALGAHFDRRIAPSLMADSSSSLPK